MAEKVADGTLVYYHGSKEKYHGLAFVDVNKGMLERYTLIPFAFDAGDKHSEGVVGKVGAGHLYDVRRGSFTVVELPAQPMKRGIYEWKGKSYPYRKTLEGKWQMWMSKGEYWTGSSDIDETNERWYAAELKFLAGL